MVLCGLWLLLKKLALSFGCYGYLVVFLVLGYFRVNSFS